MNAKQRAGQAGGRETFRRRGREWMSSIGKRGAAALYQKYNLVPASTSGWALIEKQTGKIRAVWS